MKCDPCSQKTTLAVPGKCNNCSGLTSAFANQLCATCSDDLDLCESCAGPLDEDDLALTSAAPVAAANVYVTTVIQSQAGKTFGSLRPGEEIHIVLDEDQYSGAEWDVVTPLSSCFRLKSKGQFTQNVNNPQYGSRTFVFTVVNSGSAKIEFHEVSRYRGWYGSPSGSSVIPNGKTFSANFNVK